MLILASAAAFATYRLGVAQGQAGRIPPVVSIGIGEPFPKARQNFLEAVEVLKKKSYNDDLTDEIVYYAALKGVLRHLSPESHKDMLELWKPDVDRAHSEAVTGKLASIGVHLKVDKKSRLIIDDIVPGGPAEKAGLRLRDRIYEIDGKSLGGLSFGEAEAKLHRSSGTVIALGIERPEGVMTVAVTCELYKARDVRARRIKDFGVVRIHFFSDGVHKELPLEVEALRAAGAKGIVLDLRGNAGGVVDVAQLAACAFLRDNATVVHYGGRDRRLGAKLCPKDGDLKTPLVVLADERTVSSAELFTAALKENGRAKVIGATTKGFGALKELHKLKNGYAFTLLTDVLYGPGQKTWLGKGVAPDKEVALSEDDLQEARLETDPDKLMLLDKQLAQAAALLDTRAAPRP